MDVVVSKTKLEDTKRGNEGIHSLLYEARNNVVYRSTEEQNFKQAVRDKNPRKGLAQIVNLGSETQLKETRFGEPPVGSYASYQLSHTESSFSVCQLIFPRKKINNQLLAYPRFPLRESQEPVVHKPLSGLERKLYESLCIDEETVNTIEKETRDQSNSERWKLERKYRFTASKFHLISPGNAIMINLLKTSCVQRLFNLDIQLMAFNMSQKQLTNIINTSTVRNTCARFQKWICCMQ